MVVECSHCGAPLDVHEGVTITRCVYCGRKDERKNLRTIHEATPQDFVPPKRWRPPAHVAASSTEEYPYKEAANGATFVAILIALCVAVAAAIPLWLSSRHRPPAPPAPAAIAAPTAAASVDPRIFQGAKLAGTIDVVHKQLGGNKNGSADITFTVTHSTWNKVVFSWPTIETDHVGAVLFYRTGQNTAEDSARIARALGIRARLGDTWRWNGLSIEIAATALWCTVLKRGSPVDPQWRRKLDVAYAVLDEIVYGHASSIGIDERREVLGAGRPLADLARVDPSTSIDDAPKAVPAALPGVLVTPKSSQLEVYFAIDHPRVAYTRLIWPNTRGAKLDTVVLEPDRAWAKPDSPVVACLTKAFGAAKATDTDYLSKKVKYTFTVAGGRLTLTDWELRLSSDKGGTPIQKEVFSTLVATLDACR